MTTREIWHEILIDAPPAVVYGALTDVRKLAHWWTTDTRGEAAKGKHLEFWFGATCQKMDVLAQNPDGLVQWRAAENGAPNWGGTELEFKLFKKDGQTLVHFRHSKWSEDAPSFPECSLRWAVYLLSLREYAETGKGRPFPYDFPVNMTNSACRH